MGQGGFQFAKLHIDRSLKSLNYKNTNMGYIGRPSQHSFATGSNVCYKKEEKEIYNEFEKRILQ